MKPVVFLGRSLAAIRRFPDGARRAAGYQIDRLQRGLNPDDWKAMPSIGHNVREIRIRDAGQFRVVYLANLPDRIVILHGFQKKSQRTRKSDIRQARRVLEEM
jgi:phage-related protein